MRRPGRPKRVRDLRLIQSLDVPCHTELDRLTLYLADERAIRAVEDTFIEWLVEELPEHPGRPGVVSAHDHRDNRVEP